MRSRFVYGLLAAMLFCLASCQKDHLHSGDTQLRFSTDTLTFDTVFTTISSDTRSFKIYNPYSERVRIDEIKLSGGAAASFHLNIDGIAGDDQSNIEIEAHDSIYVFAEVTVDPNAATTPLIVTDDIQIICNGQTQHVFLMAWGQDAYFHYGEIINASETWAADKPHVLIGRYDTTEGEYIPGVKVKTGTLTISPGARIYAFTTGGILVDAGGKLLCNGSPGDTIRFEGHRLEHYFDDQAGQWLGIFILRGSTGNQMSYTVVNESSYGIDIGGLQGSSVSLADFTNASRPDITIQQSAIRNSYYYSLFGINASIHAVNSIFSNNADAPVGGSRANMLTFTLGGDYQFTHCTIYNSGSSSDHQAQSLLMSNVAYDATSSYVNDLNAAFTNCILHGSLDDEISLSQDAGAVFRYNFDHCLLKTKITPDTIGAPSAMTSCLRNEDPLFEDVSNYQFWLKTGSPALNSGMDAGISNDYFNNSRPFGIAPDMGAFEMH